jgi:hypothetical protein
LLPDPCHQSPQNSDCAAIEIKGTQVLHQLVPSAESKEEKPMTTRKVSIWIRYKQDGEWIMKKAHWSANKRHLVPGMAKGARQPVAEYLYYLRYQREGKRVMEAAGRDSIQAVALATTREIELFAAERGQKAPEAAVESTNSRNKISEVIHKYLRQIAGNVKRTTYNAYRLVLENFEQAVPAVRIPRPSDTGHAPGIRCLAARALRPDHSLPSLFATPHIPNEERH